MSKYIFPLHCSHPEHGPFNPAHRSITTSLIFEDLPETRKTALRLATLAVARDNPLCPVCRETLTINPDLSDLIYR